MMDGAKYHKRDFDAVPAKSKNKGTHVRWLLRQGVPASMLMKKKVLQQLVEEKCGPANYETVTVASKWGRKVLFTPPYHPEHQPIELIWAAIKNPITKTPCSTMASWRRRFTKASTASLRRLGSGIQACSERGGGVHGGVSDSTVYRFYMDI
ncbi:unnamed protein product [Phytophthora fragariaefolia]|uniref:Unnamed protein product n=1 Tax=Phytophthora fragariaefolia TaxID=1490495 RepID=A0A9W6TT80_9STRA|nr:unnamed protein product [Phytophthora fragariaefolia]